jgi:hypothetical protein
MNGVNALLRETELIDLALSLKDHGLVLEQPFQDALVAHVNQKLSDRSSGRLASQWPNVFGLLDQPNFGAFRQRLLNAFKDISGRIAGLLPYYGQLLHSVALEKGPEEFFNRIMQIIQFHETDEIAWLSHLMLEWSPRTQGAVDVRRDWEKRVEGYLEEELSAEARAGLNELLQALRSR